MRHPLSRVALAAAAVIVVAVWLLSARQSIALDDLAAPLVNAKSARFKMVVKTEILPKEQTFVGYFLAPNRYRQEGLGIVTVSDWDRGRMMSLVAATKQAMIFDLKGLPGGKEPATKKMQNYFGDLRSLLAQHRNSKEGEVEKLGEKDIAGRQAFGFRLAVAGQTFRLWGEVASGRVLRIESTMAGPPKTDVVASDFEFDVPLDPSLFAVEPPAGYKAITAEMDVSRPEEKDLVAALERLTEATGGEFPAGFDAAALAMAFVKLAGGKTGDEAMKKLMTEGAKIGRGLSFAMTLPAEADARYAGKGVKRGGPKSPIFWYKPTGAAKYRIVWSDLSVSEEEQAPTVDGAVLEHTNESNLFRLPLQEPPPSPPKAPTLPKKLTPPRKTPPPPPKVPPPRSLAPAADPKSQ